MRSCHPAWYRFEHNASYDASGNNDATWGEDTQGSNAETALLLHDESRSYYGPDEQLMVRNRHLGLGTGSYPGGVFEEYRYDALGRRVFVRSRRTSSCAQAPGYHYQCGSYVERTVWDGDQVLYEIRGGGSDSLDAWFLEDDGGALPATEPHMFGRAVYTHALGIDQPVGILRLDAGAWNFLAPHANWRGSYTYGTLASGAVCPGAVDCPLAPWPGDTRTADGGSTSTEPTQYTSWYGNLITNKADGSGLQYMRNRYYDPGTGRFTQQDPIGLAGGLNLYGFAAGDPVNFSDPFGLCPPRLTGRPCLLPVPGGGGIRTSADNPQIGRFGMVRNDGTRAHQGIDILGPLGNGVVAADDGVVTWAGPREGYGNLVEIEHRNGQGEIVSFTAYAHLDEVNVKKGQSIAGGKPLGSIGSSGNARGTEPHLHFEIRTRSLPPKGLDGRLNPLPWNRQ